MTPTVDSMSDATALGRLRSSELSWAGCGMKHVWAGGSGPSADGVR